MPFIHKKNIIFPKDSQQWVTSPIQWACVTCKNELWEALKKKTKYVQWWSPLWQMSKQFGRGSLITLCDFFYLSNSVYMSLSVQLWHGITVSERVYNNIHGLREQTGIVCLCVGGFVCVCRMSVSLCMCLGLLPVGKYLKYEMLMIDLPVCQ